MSYPFAFEAPIERFGVGRSKVIWYNVLFLPSALQAEPGLGASGPVRVEGEVAEVPVQGAWMPTGDGRRWFIVCPAVFKAAGVAVGDLVEMRFRLDDPDRVDIPEPLAQALARDAAAAAQWARLTPGKRRGLAHPVAAARTAQTAAKRVARIMQMLKE